MKTYLACFFLLFTSLFLVTQKSFAGEVLHKPCPFSCRTLGIDKKYCKDWKDKRPLGECYVEIEPNAKGNMSEITYPCPLSCAMLKIPKSRCKDWKNEEKKCVVQF